MPITLEDWVDGVTIFGYRIVNLRYADGTILFATTALIVCDFHRLQKVPFYLVGWNNMGERSK